MDVVLNVVVGIWVVAVFFTAVAFVRSATDPNPDVRRIAAGCLLAAVFLGWLAVPGCLVYVAWVAFRREG